MDLKTKEGKNTNVGHLMLGCGLSIGAGLGISLGVVFNSIPIGISIGAGVGLSIGLALSSYYNAKAC